MLTLLPGIGRCDPIPKNFRSAQVYGLLVAVGLFGFVVNDLFAIIEAIVIWCWPVPARVSVWLAVL